MPASSHKLLEPGAQLERLTGLLANIHDPDYVDSAGLPASPDRCPRWVVDRARRRPGSRLAEGCSPVLADG